MLRDVLSASEFASVHLVVAGGYDTRMQENVSYYEELRGMASAAGLLDDRVSHSMDAILPNFPPSNKSTAQMGYNHIESSSKVTFVRSFTDDQKALLLLASTAVVYTPPNEHFGIVPLEAMAAFRPVIAVNSGGPLESVAPESTGFLCSPEPVVR